MADKLPCTAPPCTRKTECGRVECPLRKPVTAQPRGCGSVQLIPSSGATVRPRFPQ